MITPVKQLFQENSEAYADLMGMLEGIPLLNWMVNPNRPRAKDLPRDKQGRIIVNVTQPHVLENMDYFIPAANAFRENGKYCIYYPSKSPNSPYKKFWDEEIRRCKEGYVRESDGEWITGYHYYYLNYARIQKTVIVGERNKDGSVKADREADFPDIWDGDYMFFHYVEQAEQAGKYGAVLKARGKGYSFKLATMLQRNYFLYTGSKSYALAAESEYLDSDGILNKADDNFSFINQYAGFAKRLALKDTLMQRKAGYKKPGDPTEYGTKSERIGVTLKNKPDKARGKRGMLIAWEEAGSFPNLIKSWTLARKSLEDGNRVFGFMVAFGTGGEEGVSFMGLEQLFYKPTAYKVYALRNVFDKNSDRAVCALFIPDYLNRADCYDKDGNSDVIKALFEIISSRLSIKYGSDDVQYITQSKAEEPVTPQEAIMQTKGNDFPVETLKDYQATISPTHADFTSHHEVVELFWTGKSTVDYKPVFDKHPIRTWPYKGRNIQGAIEVFEMPKRTQNGEIPWGRYIGGVDPVDDDTNLTQGVSLFSIWIFDLWDDVYVAEWTGRYPKAGDNYEIALKLAVWYNAEINYENKLKGLFEYFSRKHMLRYLMDTPKILKDMDYIKDKNTFGNKAKGTPTNEQINSWGRKLQAEWMVTENAMRNVMGYQTIRSFAYLKECISWNLDQNFDRVSAGNMVFIARADRYAITHSRSETTEESADYENDSFFTDNYQLPTAHNFTQIGY